MGSLIPSDLSLGSRFLSAPKVSSIGEFLTEVSRIHNASERIAKLDDYIDRLEVEMKKIDAFKRELPLCMLLVNDAIATIKGELVQCKKLFSVPVFEEFMPLKKSTEEKDEKIESNKENDVNNSRDKMNWMSSVQLWSSDNQHHNLNSEFSNHKQTSKLDKLKVVKEETNGAMDGLLRSCKNRAVETAFVPLKGCTNFPVMLMRKEDRNELIVVPRLSLGTPESKNLREEMNSYGSKSSCSRSGSSSATNDQSNIRTAQQSHQTARKQRRCWSPELHRRFVNALQQLGGAQAATPKQIRELMQVDGLSNDEVKSHLQKYRLHTRRVPPTTNTSTNQPSVLGGPWMSQEQCGESSKQSNSQSRSPQGPTHLTGSSRGTSLTGGDSMEDEDEDDEKSESQSWKNQIQLSRRNDV